jgi:hypothetical protein
LVPIERLLRNPRGPPLHHYDLIWDGIKGIKGRAPIYSVFLALALFGYYIFKDDALFVVSLFSMVPISLFLILSYAMVQSLIRLSTTLFIVLINLLIISSFALLLGFPFALTGLSNIGAGGAGLLLGIPSRFDEIGHLEVFPINIVSNVVGYAYLFDETDTINPSWVGIFG